MRLRFRCRKSPSILNTPVGRLRRCVMTTSRGSTPRPEPRASRGNLTGVATLVPGGAIAKDLQLLSGLVPTARRIAVLNVSNPWNGLPDLAAEAKPPALYLPCALVEAGARISYSTDLTRSRSGVPIWSTELWAEGTPRSFRSSSPRDISSSSISGRRRHSALILPPRSSGPPTR